MEYKVAAMIKKLSYLGILILLVSFAYGAVAQAESDKYDGDCTPQETLGRCADKCPALEYLQGYDKETGAAVCANPPQGCSYAEQLTADDTHCVAPTNTAAVTPTPSDPSPPAPVKTSDVPFLGK